MGDDRSLDQTVPCEPVLFAGLRITQCFVSIKNRSRTVDDVSARILVRASVSATNHCNSSVGPVRKGYCSIANRS